MPNEKQHNGRWIGDATLSPVVRPVTPPGSSRSKQAHGAKQGEVAAVAKPGPCDEDDKSHAYSRFDLMRLDPFREPSWRWNAAGKPLNADDETWASPFMHQAHAYRQALAEASDKDAVEKVRRRYPQIALAHDIHDDNGPLRWELQARLLADESYDQIALKAGVPVEVVECYETLFFDLQGLDWKLIQVIRTDLVDNAPSEATVWMYMGLAGGPIAVDLIVSDYLCRPTPKIPNRHQLAEQARLLALFYLTVSRNREQLKILAAKAAVLFNPDQAGLSKSDSRRRAECLGLLNMAAANFEAGEAYADWTSDLLNKLKDAAAGGTNNNKGNSAKDIFAWMKM